MHEQDRQDPKLPLIGRTRVLLDLLAKRLHTEASRHHNYTKLWETKRGDAFEVMLRDSDGELTGHIVRVTVELDRFDATITPSGGDKSDADAPLMFMVDGREYVAIPPRNLAVNDGVDQRLVLVLKGHDDPPE